MKDEGLDFLPMVLLLALVVFISFKLVMPIYYDSRQLEYSESYDKTVAKIEGEQHINNNSFDADYTYEELILTLANQTYFMPSPRVLDVFGYAYQIQMQATEVVQPNESYTATAVVDYVPGNKSTLLDIKAKVYEWCNKFTDRYGKNGFKLHFVIRLSRGTVEGASDDCYKIYVVAIYNDGTKEYLECFSNGTIGTVPEGAVVPLYS